ncbi:hypothetical protein ILYODFUR_023312 [Ilyodon furcidens]|uniref:Uncharacterized protein n=1 Tax=Ilyodon furcidens TaxID=33524 RepID=A0ABV0TAF2_9TELE
MSFRRWQLIETKTDGLIKNKKCSHDFRDSMNQSSKISSISAASISPVVKGTSSLLLRQFLLNFLNFSCRHRLENNTATCWCGGFTPVCSAGVSHFSCGPAK